MLIQHGLQVLYRFQSDRGDRCRVIHFGTWKDDVHFINIIIIIIIITISSSSSSSSIIINGDKVNEPMISQTVFPLSLSLHFSANKF